MAYVTIQPPAGWSRERYWAAYEAAVEAREGDHEGSGTDGSADELYCTIDPSHCAAFVEELRALGFWVSTDDPMM